MSSTERREREREELRRLILNTTLEMLGAEDPNHLSMRRIAEKIDYSPTAIYLHFKDKGELMDALASEGFTYLAEALEAVRAQTAAARLRGIGEAYIAFAFARPALYRLMFQSTDGPSLLYNGHHTHRQASARAFGLLVNAVRLMQPVMQPDDEDRRDKADEPDAETFAAGVFWAHVHGAASLMLTNRGRLFAEVRPEFCRRAVETAVAGLLAAFPAPLGTL